MATSTQSQRPWPTSFLVAAALFLTFLQTFQQEPESNYAELVACALSWGVVFGIVRVIQRYSKTRAGDDDHAVWKYWAVAALVAVTEWLGRDMKWLWPLVTFLLLCLGRVFWRSGTADDSKEGLLASLATTTSTAVPLIKIVEAVAIAAFSLVALMVLSYGFRLPTIAFGVISAFAWTAVFSSFKMLSGSRDDLMADGTTDYGIVLGARLAWRVAVLLGGICVLYPILSVPEPLHWSIALRGLLSGGQWLLIFAIAETATWEITTSILAFSSAGLNSRNLTVSFLAQGTACALALYQTIGFVPRSSKYRGTLWIFLGIPLALFLQPVRYAYFPPSEILPNGLHPIEALAYRADAQFQHMLQRQSKTLQAAAKEYTRRYKRSPPPGFQHWFEYAMEHNSPIIDDFDIIDEAITPLWSMSGEEVLRVMREVEEADGARLWGCKIQHGQWVEPCMEGAMRSLLTSFQAHVPDVKLFFNGLDEPRLLETAAPDTSQQWTETTHRNVWADLIGPCDSFGEKKENHQSGLDTQGIPFIQDTLDSIDLCKHPEYKDLHGIWMAPSNWVVTPATVPILSPGRPSTMRDLVYPAAAYTQDRYMYDATKDMPFEQKKPGLYWVGSTTGNFVSNDTDPKEWKQFHRQRFVRFANALDRAEGQQEKYLAYNATTDTWEPESDVLLTADYHVRLSNIVQCEPAGCEAQKEYFASAMTDWAPVEESLSYTLTMDLDGNGHSGRYYQLLGSRSLPLKQTVLKEWHDDRLVPWAHFVPISLGLEEVPEVVRFFVQEESGIKLAEELAEKGRLWHARALRPVDMAIYMYRLILEIARLQDPGRVGQTL